MGKAKIIVVGPAEIDQSLRLCFKSLSLEILYRGLFFLKWFFQLMTFGEVHSDHASRLVLSNTDGYTLVLLY